MKYKIYKNKWINKIHDTRVFIWKLNIQDMIIIKYVQCIYIYM